jgi:putative ABC transport system permease protein
MLRSMLRIALAGLRAHKLRTVLTGLAVAIALGLLGGSLIYGATARAAFLADLAQAAEGVDVVATPDGHPARSGQAALDAVAQCPGVAHVDGRVVTGLGLIGRNGRVVTNGGSVGVAMSLPSWPGFQRFRTVAGRLPAGAGEAALDRPTADRERLTPGGTITVADRTGRTQSLALVGLIDLGTDRRFADNSVVVLVPADLAQLTGPGDGALAYYDQIVVAARPGTDPAQLRADVAAALGPEYQVATGDELRHDLAVQAAKYVDEFLTTLLATTLVTLVVAAVVIFNTFRVVLAGRIRELALLRCVGARRGQLARLVLAEAFGVSLIASLLGLLLSVAVGAGLLVARRLHDRDLPPWTLVVPGSAVALTVLAGVALTVVCGLLPALSASRVSPLQALQASEAIPARPARHPVLATAAALVLLAGGAVLVRSGRGEGFAGLVPMAGGAMLGFVALVIVLPFLVRPFTAFAGLVGVGRFGTPGRLAVRSAARNPIRFATMSTALMVGIAPLTMFAVMLTTARVQAQRELSENFSIDFVVEHAAGDADRTALPPALIERARGSRDFAAVVLGQVARGLVDGAAVEVGAVEAGALGATIAPEVMDGTLGALRTGTVGLRGAFAAAHDLRVGETVELSAGDELWSATIVTIFDDTPLPVDALLDIDDFHRHLAGEDYLMIRRAPGVSAADAQARLDDVVADDPLAVVSSTAQRRDALAHSLDGRLLQFDVLLGVSLLLGLAGIANTLTLAVLERRRESALLRALGLARRQLRATLLVEALLVAMLGAALGIGFGLFFGWLAADELIGTYGHGRPQVPAGLIGGYLGLVLAAAALASILPGRRAARAPVVSGLVSE